MKVVIDTNVFVSGVFFGGPPGSILEAWQDGRVQLVISQEILAEYVRVGNELATQFPNIDPLPFFEQVVRGAELFDCPPLPIQVCADPDDDKFLACAIAAVHLAS